jgi:hypothetical protein
MMMPSGRSGWFIKCRMAEDACLDKATEVCPGGYEVVRAREYGEVAHRQDMLGSRSEERFSHGTLMVECRRQHRAGIEIRTPQGQVVDQE